MAKVYRLGAARRLVNALIGPGASRRADEVDLPSHCPRTPHGRAPDHTGHFGRESGPALARITLR
jgi:hypothetical protein